MRGARAVVVVLGLAVQMGGSATAGQEKWITAAPLDTLAIRNDSSKAAVPASAESRPLKPWKERVGIPRLAQNLREGTGSLAFRNRRGLIEAWTLVQVVKAPACPPAKCEWWGCSEDGQVGLAIGSLLFAVAGDTVFVPCASYDMLRNPEWLDFENDSHGMVVTVWGSSECNPWTARWWVHGGAVTKSRIELTEFPETWQETVWHLESPD